MGKSFLQRVRRGEVKILPTHVGRFSREGWKAAYESSAPPEISDQRLFESGLWLGDRITWVTEKAAKIPFSSKKIERAVRLHIGFVNRETAGVRLMSLESKSSDLLIAEQVVSGRFESPNFGYSATPADIHEAVTDGLKIALDSLRQKQGRDSSNASTAEEEQSGVLELQKVVEHINCGILFDAFVDLWNSFLWEEKYVQTKDGVDIITPSDPGFEITSAVSRFRADRLLTEVVTTTCRHWANQIFAPVQTGLRQKNKFFINKIERVGKGKNSDLDLRS